jgi:hypothetical protein
MAKLIEPRSIPLTSPVTVAHFCRPRMCSMSVNGYASTKVRYREITAERRTMTTLQMVRREAFCACCRGFLDGKLNRRHFVRAVAIGAATFGLVPHIALAAEGNYEAMILSCIDPRMQEPVHKYTVEQNLTGKFSQFVMRSASSRPRSRSGTRHFGTISARRFSCITSRRSSQSTIAIAALQGLPMARPKSQTRKWRPKRIRRRSRNSASKPESAIHSSA